MNNPSKPAGINSMIMRDLVISIIILLFPFLFYTYELVPETRVWETFLFRIDFDFFEEAKYFFWVFNIKLMTILVLSMWYITCSKKWKYFILIALIMEWYRFFGLLSDEFGSYVYVSIFKSFIRVLPFSLIMIFITLIVGRILGYHERLISSKDKSDMALIDFLNKYNKLDSKKVRKYKLSSKLISYKNSLTDRDYKKQIKELERIKRELSNLSI